MRYLILAVIGLFTVAGSLAAQRQRGPEFTPRAGQQLADGWRALGDSTEKFACLYGRLVPDSASGLHARVDSVGVPQPNAHDCGLALGIVRYTHGQFGTDDQAFTMMEYVLDKVDRWEVLAEVYGVRRGTPMIRSTARFHSTAAPRGT